MIIRGGFNVYPREIEEVLTRTPRSPWAAVIGVPHESHGEEVKAVRQSRDEGRRRLEESWYCKEHLAAYKYPRIVEFATACP